MQDESYDGVHDGTHDGTHDGVHVDTHDFEQDGTHKYQVLLDVRVPGIFFLQFFVDLGGFNCCDCC